jgi:cell division protein FtsB
MIDAANLQAQLAHIKAEHEKLKQERDELRRQVLMTLLTPIID